jgi:hypothetical protein
MCQTSGLYIALVETSVTFSSFMSVILMKFPSKGLVILFPSFAYDLLQLNGTMESSFQNLLSFFKVKNRNKIK